MINNYEESINKLENDLTLQEKFYEDKLLVQEERFNDSIVFEQNTHQIKLESLGNSFEDKKKNN